MHVPLHAVRGRALATAPEAVQPDAGIGVDHAGDRVVQAGLGHVALVDVGNVPAVQAPERPRGLARTQPAAVAEGGRHIPLARALQLGLEARDRAEVPGPIEPMLRVGQRLQHAGREEVRFEQPFKERAAVRGVAGAQPLHHGLTTHDFDVLVLREAPIGGSSRGAQASLEGSNEGRRLGRHAGLLGVARDVAAILVPGDELGAVVAVLLAAWDAKVARLQFVDHLGEQADLEVAPVHLGGCWRTRRVPGQQRPPFLAHPGQVERLAGCGAAGLHHVHGGPQLGAPVRAVRQQEGDRLLGGAVL